MVLLYRDKVIDPGITIATLKTTVGTIASKQADTTVVENWRLGKQSIGVDLLERSMPHFALYFTVERWN